jgi:hypothetical protein
VSVRIFLIFDSTNIKFTNTPHTLYYSPRISLQGRLVIDWSLSIPSSLLAPRSVVVHVVIVRHLVDQIRIVIFHVVIHFDKINHKLIE